MRRASSTEMSVVPSLRRRAPGPRGAPFLGSVLDLQRRGQVPFSLENWRAYGDVVRFNLGPFVAHILAHPDHIHHVLITNAQNYNKGPSYAKVRPFLGLGLLTSEGDFWRRQRRLMQPPFTYRSVLQYTGEMLAAIEAMLADWETAARQGTALAINREMVRLALIIIGKTIFSSDLGDRVQTIIEAAIDVTTVVNRHLASFIDIPLAMPTPDNRRFKNALRRLDAVVYEVIEARRGSRPARARTCSTGSWWRVTRRPAPL
ncbi:MAG: cytochrome P450 [Ardenticatenaceae bacterium]|nr:cytochrome P450 [Ardenticatenaceae bacterium]